MDESGVDFAMDVHGDEAIPANFLAGFEGIPSVTDRQLMLFKSFSDALERVSPVKGFREFVIGLVSFVKHLEIPGVFTATTSSLLGGDSITGSHISTTTDSPAACARLPLRRALRLCAR